MDICLHNSKKTIAVSDAIFSASFNEALVHQVITAYLAGARQGNSAQKSRSDVRGGGAKPWKQKGTGRARAGTIRSPLWRSGGVTFASEKRSYKQKVNRKMYRGALRAIFSELHRQQRLHIVDDFKIEEPKTRLIKDKLAAMELQNVLIVTEEVDVNLYLAVRNLRDVRVIDVSAIEPVTLIAHENVLISTRAVQKIEELLV